VPAYHQVTPMLPPAASLQSLSPLTTTNATLTQPAASHVSSPLSPTTGEESSMPDDEKEKLKTDLQQLKSELQKSRETIARLQKSEEQMRER
jgi:hypothetical protein